MENYFRYFPTSEKDESWGLTVLNAGCTQIEKHSYYPPLNHPSHHYFNWDTGRTLDEYQLIYITKGVGYFESENCSENITEGSVILLHPEQRHRYKPDFETGWNEFWVGFKGIFMDNIVAKEYFDPAKTVFNVGFNGTILSLFNDILKFSTEEKPGYQQAISGAVIYLLGLLHSEHQQDTLLEKDIIEETVDKARLIFRERINENVTPEKVAEELKVGYSWFRKIFKKYTGLAPGQYLIQLKIQKAKELLADPSKRVKEIAFELDIESSFYFSRLFKDKVGLTPVEYRNQVLKKHKFN
ncbi:MAG TPA: AraC family transcriptional regulator [Pedobacter sp.]|uniref:AraC family transcriptional regulator n=1 Tax=Pedobacter sp. TaxID=1411316 RepID=UPI002B5CC2DB|nr:AraC family transcriptional regulator [Pedobacter sp.]HMI03097.1 AraC family transcriptional regulator [Pedobacter sp.]